jgi:hypothetical protein
MARTVMARTGLTFALLVAGGFLVGACSTPDALGKLTEATGNNALALSVALTNLEKKSKEASALKIAAAARLSTVLARSETERRHKRTMIHAYEDSTAKGAYEEIKKLSLDAAKKAAAATESSVIAEKAITDKIKPLDSDADALRKLGTDLLEFSKEDGKFERAKAFIEFVKAVVKDLKKADDTGAAAKAKTTSAIAKTEKDAPK